MRCPLLTTSATIPIAPLRPNSSDSARQGAEEMARSADIQRGVPFLMPRTAYVNLALVAVAFGMFGLRYGMHRSLDLGSPLVHINFDGLFGDFAASGQSANRANALATNGQRDPGPRQIRRRRRPTIMIRPPTPRCNPSRIPIRTAQARRPTPSAKADAKSSEQLPPGANPLDSGEKGDSSLPKPNDANQPASGPIRNPASRMVPRTRRKTQRRKRINPAAQATIPASPTSCATRFRICWRK